MQIQIALQASDEMNGEMFDGQRQYTPKLLRPLPFMMQQHIYQSCAQTIALSTGDGSISCLETKDELLVLQNEGEHMHIV